MTTHDTILTEWRESLPQILAGNDPLDQPGGLSRYNRRVLEIKYADICSLEGCGRPYSAKGLCKKHYQQAWYRANR